MHCRWYPSMPCSWTRVNYFSLKYMVHRGESFMAHVKYFRILWMSVGPGTWKLDHQTNSRSFFGNTLGVNINRRQSIEGDGAGKGCPTPSWIHQYPEGHFTWYGILLNAFLLLFFIMFTLKDSIACVQDK